MENQKNDNLNLLEAVVQNTEMGKNTLEQIVPMTDDTQFKAELLRQRNLYHQLNQEAHTAMEACGGTAQGQSAMAKFNTKMGISMKTLTDKSTRNLAEMLTQGSGMGVVDCVKAQKDYPNAAPGTKRLAQRLMEFEEDNRVRLEQFLLKRNPLRLTLFASSPEGRALGKTENFSGMSKAPLFRGSWQCDALTERVLYFTVLPPWRPRSSWRWQRTLRC